MAFQLVGVHDGMQEVRTPLRMRYRPVKEGATVVQAMPIGSLSASLSEAPGAEGNLVLVGAASGLIGLLAGVWIGWNRRGVVEQAERALGDLGRHPRKRHSPMCRRVWVRSHYSS